MVSILKCIQKQLILHQIETGPVPLADLNEKEYSYTKLQIVKSYVALNEETYISLRQQELRNCKNIDYKSCCQELFVVEHKFKYCCESAITFNFSLEII